MRRMDNNNREKIEDNKNRKCTFCGKLRNECPRCVQVDEFFNRTDISDDDFVDNPYGYGLKKKG
jgi:hypothetical protein